MNRPEHRAGRHSLQIPVPTEVPDRVLRAIDIPDVLLADRGRGPS